MRAIFFRLALVGAMSAVAPLAHAQLLTHRDLSYSMAKTIAETAIDSCAAKGYAVSAVVVDRAGEVIVAMRADNAGPHTMENARRKAYTARSFRTSTTAYAKRFADNDPVVRQQVTLPNVIAIPGGLPVKLGDEVIAGVGVSGSPGVDEPCVQAGLDKVAEQLKMIRSGGRHPSVDQREVRRCVRPSQITGDRGQQASRNRKTLWGGRRGNGNFVAALTDGVPRCPSRTT